MIFTGDVHTFWYKIALSLYNPAVMDETDGVGTSMTL